MKFWGYRRSDGTVGIRNHVLILPACACGSESCRVVASQVRGAVNIVFNTGCSDVAANTAMSQKVLTGFACNPNVYGVVIIGLGCETVPHKELREKIQKMTDKPVVSFGIQEEGGTLKTIEKAVRAARNMAAEAALQQKVECDISELLVGIECGGSDATSGIAANPAVGRDERPAGGYGCLHHDERDHRVHRGRACAGPPGSDAGDSQSDHPHLPGI